MIKPWCCDLNCKNEAVWTIYTDREAYGETDACESHVGRLLGDKDLYFIERVYA